MTPPTPPRASEAEPFVDAAATWFIGDREGFEDRERDGEGKYVVHLTFDDPTVAKACLMRLMKNEGAP